MATSPQEARAALVAVTSSAADDLAQVWGSLALDDAVVLRDALIELVPTIGDQWGMTAGVLAADWYDELRDAAAAKGSFIAEPAPLPGSARYEALTRWGLGPLFQAEPDTSAALTLIQGGLVKAVGDMHRSTMRRSVTQDPAAQGWRRIARGSSACGFCRMLAGRGEVYGKDTARFASHDHCHCLAEPAFGGGRPVSTLQYVATKRNVGPKDRERVRAFVATLDG